MWRRLVLRSCDLRAIEAAVAASRRRTAPIATSTARAKNTRANPLTASATERRQAAAVKPASATTRADRPSQLGRVVCVTV